LLYFHTVFLLQSFIPARPWLSSSSPPAPHFH
jgi:hypothetical protein